MHRRRRTPALALLAVAALAFPVRNCQAQTATLFGLVNRPDFNRFAVGEYAAVEFYPGDASLPLQYSNRGSDCGTLLLWTRER
ncbi:MAG: hypothetical protein ABI664_08260 [bacterium]